MMPTEKSHRQMRPKSGTHSSSKFARMDDHSFLNMRFGMNLGAFYAPKIWRQSAILGKNHHTFTRTLHDSCTKKTW